MVHSHWRGHPIEKTPYGWIYSDTREFVKEDSDRKCEKCGYDNTKEGHDSCLGTLPGVLSACCGHGNREQSYIMFENGLNVKGFIVEKKKGGE